MKPTAKGNTFSVRIMTFNGFQENPMNKGVIHLGEKFMRET